MNYMFRSASAFNQPLSFDTFSVTNMGKMFFGAAAFNQPLSFDTSSVTNMVYMFNVRSSPCPAPNLQSSPLLHATCAAVVRRLPPADWYTSPRNVCPPFDSRQRASAFNQPLSFDTSSVTNMHGMFYVRSAPCLAPNLQSSPLLHAASRLPAHTSYRSVCSPCDSAGRKLPVQRQQAAHPLRVGGHLGLRLRWVWLEMGSGDLPRHIQDHGLPEGGGPGVQR